MGDIAAAAGLARVHMIAWRDLDDVEAGGSEIHAAEVARHWAEAGIEVLLRTSYAQGHPPRARRDGYQVVRKAGRYLVFPRAALAEVAHRYGRRDALVEIWNGMPFFSPLWATGPRVVFLHHVHADMWKMVLPPNLARIGDTVPVRLYGWPQGVVTVRVCGGGEYIDSSDCAVTDAITVAINENGEGRGLLTITERKRSIDICEFENGQIISVVHQPMADGGWVETHQDITEQRRSEARIHHLARHDALTDLPNRTLFAEEMVMAESRVRRGEMMAVLFFDLDHFKIINDTLGHAIGDAVLKEVAARINHTKREHETAAAIPGDPRPRPRAKPAASPQGVSLSLQQFEDDEMDAGFERASA